MSKIKFDLSVSIICMTILSCASFMYYHFKESREFFKDLERVEYTYRNDDGKTIKNIHYKKTEEVEN